MAETSEYTFKIADFTPDTMPFGRLVTYYSELKKMLGVADNAHLVSVFEGSHASTFAVEQMHDNALQERLVMLNEGTAPKSATRARDTINAMLREDGTSAAFFDCNNRNIIKFPGKRSEQDVLYRIRDAASFTGELYHIAGTVDDVKVRLSTNSHGTVFCKTTRDIGKALREFLFEDVCVSGRGMWTRTTDGHWDIDDFTVTDFAPVRTDSLRNTIKRIRDLDIEWPDDPIKAIGEIEEKNGQLH